MSDSEIARLTIAVERLTLATEELANLIRGRSSALSVTPVSVAESASASQSQAQFVIQLDELSRQVFPTQFREQVLRDRYRDLEEGPPPVPDYAVKYCREKLSSKPPGIDIRAREAFNAGFWARVAIDTVTNYKPRTLQKGLHSRHWIVLRSSAQAEFRTTSRRDLSRICNLQDTQLICEAFETIVECELFCLGAHRALPCLKSCSDIWWSLPQVVKTVPFWFGSLHLNALLTDHHLHVWLSPWWGVPEVFS